MEARDASGKLIAKDHVEIITAGTWMIPAFIAATVVGVALAVPAWRIDYTWLRILLVVLGVIVAAIGAGSLGAAVWGQRVGMPWHFTP